MLLDEEIKNYTKPTTKKEARKNIQSFWFNLFDTQQGTIFENLTERTQIVMKLLYQELSAFDKRIRQDIKITFNTDRSRYWKEYITAFPDKKKNKKPALKIRKQKQELKNINEQIEDRTFIQQQQNKQLQAQANQIKQQGDKLKEIKQEQDILKQNTELEEKMAVKQFTDQIIQASKGLMPELYPYLPHDDNDAYSEATNDYFGKLWKNLKDDNRNILTATKLLLIRKCWKAFQSNKLQISFKDLITETDNLIKMSSGSYDTINPEVKIEVSKSYTQINNQDNSVNNTQINNQQDIEDKNIIEEILDIPKDYIVKKNNIEDKN